MRGHHAKRLETVSNNPEKRELTKSEIPVSHETSLRREPRGIWSTFDEMERRMEESLHRPFLFDFGFPPISRFLHDLRGEGELKPYVDIFTIGNELVVKAEMPGMKREDINVKLVDNDLILYGEKKSEERVEEKDYLRLERSFGSFRRTLRLPEGVMSEKISASFKNGVLEIRLPRETSTAEKIITIE